VRWVAADICKAQLDEAAYDVWHDRAVFHFLTEPADRRVSGPGQARTSRRPRVVAAFRRRPERCSNAVVR
jgi:hypothetical protein